MTTPRQPCPNGQPDHYWVIEPSNGSKSSGVCSFCGESRQFLNSTPWSEQKLRIANVGPTKPFLHPTN